MFENLDFEILNNPEYKEDSVREDIIVPILKRLGYSSSGANKIRRGIKLTHPFVNIGSIKRKINIIPDYILETENNSKWVLDAKAPNENILKSGNVEQAYSYAINPEVRCDIYSLCNGRKFTVFHISEIEPILDIDIIDIDKKWNLIEEVLSPTYLEKPFLKDFDPDFGIHLLKLGVPLDTIFYFIPIFVQNIAKVNDELYTIYSVVNYGEDYGISLDFGKDKLEEFINCVPIVLRDYIRKKLKNAPYHANFNSLDEMFPISVGAKRGARIIKNNNETYIPFEITQFTNNI
ncbi:type I restriction enzyme HsdR N-terminal domain-containing protein [Myroides marinus]|uniref:type I restriction enzyme HsdR N-terminal domain-containing protein n=1 Tax=Myroides marinus TaxID=703342 RepID=UPI0025792151|nr:type I restriction enzyme HsdR N-terminal domain-containing protein [Myroides marinus]MDM1503938.1 type I restriction enzyme HsdR N-terminal domain-containing protein [Myroides marinus]